MLMKILIINNSARDFSLLFSQLLMNVLPKNVNLKIGFFNCIRELYVLMCSFPDWKKSLLATSYLWYPQQLIASNI